MRGRVRDRREFYIAAEPNAKNFTLGMFRNGGPPCAACNKLGKPCGRNAVPPSRYCQSHRALERRR